MDKVLSLSSSMKDFQNQLENSERAQLCQINQHNLEFSQIQIEKRIIYKESNNNGNCVSIVSSSILCEKCLEKITSTVKENTNIIFINYKSTMEKFIVDLFDDQENKLSFLNDSVLKLLNLYVQIHLKVESNYPSLKSSISDLQKQIALLEVIVSEEEFLKKKYIQSIQLYLIQLLSNDNSKQINEILTNLSKYMIVNDNNTVSYAKFRYQTSMTIKLNIQNASQFITEFSQKNLSTQEFAEKLIICLNAPIIQIQSCFTYLETKVHLDLKARTYLNIVDKFNSEFFHLPLNQSQNADKINQFTINSLDECINILQLIYQDYTRNNHSKDDDNSDEKSPNIYDNINKSSKKRDENYYYRLLESQQQICLFLLTFCHDQGVGVEVNKIKAFYICNQSNNLENSKGYPVLQDFIGKCYQYGIGCIKDSKMAFHYYELSSEKQFSIAQNNVGMCYYTGYGAEKVDELAVQYFLMSAEQGNSLAQYNLARCFYYGIGVEKNYNLAITYFKTSSDQCNETATYKLAKCYQLGIGAKKNYQFAQHYYEISGKNGFAKGYLKSGECLELGRVRTRKILNKTFKRYKLAAKQNILKGQINLDLQCEFVEDLQRNQNLQIRYYSQKADEGIAYAQLLLGNIFFNGTLILRNYSVAAQYFENSAQQGNALGLNALGLCYLKGQGVNCNQKLAFECFDKSAQKGNIWAENNLGNCYYRGKGVQKNYDLAVQHYKIGTKESNFKDSGFVSNSNSDTKVIQQENGLNVINHLKYDIKAYGEALNNLGQCYYNGQGVEKDYNMAFKYFQKSVRQGWTKAYNNLGECLLNGNGIQQDDELAVQYFQISANKGNLKSYNNLGHCYYYGRGVNQSFQLAATNYLKGQQETDLKALNNLGACCYYCKNINKNLELAFNYYKQSADAGYAEAQNHTGECFLYGSGIKKDITQAIQYFEKSAAQGCSEAYFNLGQCISMGYQISKDYENIVKLYLLNEQIQNNGVLISEKKKIINKY